MNARMTTGITAILIGLYFVGYANAAKTTKSVCAPRNIIISKLKKHDEVPRHRGFSSSGNVLEITVSQKDDKAWTAMLTNPQGITCLVSAGLYWETLLVEPIVKSKDTATFDTH